MAKMVSIGAAADYYDVSRQTVRRWIASGKITAYRVEPRLIRIRPRRDRSEDHPQGADRKRSA